MSLRNVSPVSLISSVLRSAESPSVHIPLRSVSLLPTTETVEIAESGIISAENLSPENISALFSAGYSYLTISAENGDGDAPENLRLPASP